ncbi:hypothetical protein BK022_10890 [Methylorubrum extorquens]|uniref:Replication protein n=1 Tax=Methylorubrum extorquens TaxID=408 RepID=A0A1S1P7L1_METEX|nr:hypothetical protein BK022_10890 [Methylorubrum extorquens]
MNAVTIEPATGLLCLSRALASELLPFEHAAIIHPSDTRTAAIFRGSWFNPDRRCWEDNTFAAHGGNVEEAVARGTPRFVTMNAFRTRSACFKSDWRENPWKETQNLAALQAVWTELDFHDKPAWKHLSPAEMIFHVIERIRSRGWPLPTYILCSGSGLHVVWLHTRVSPRKAMGIWKALQQALNDAFIDMGRDKAAMSATTNLRLAGTKNEGRPVSILWPVHVDEIVRHDFDELCRAILPYTVDEARAYKAKLREQKTARQARIAAPTGTPRLTGTTFYATLLADLDKVMTDRFPGVVDDGHRNEMLFIHARVWAWLMEPDELIARIKAEAPRFGFTQREALTHMRSVINRAKSACNVGRGQADPRYKIGPQRIRVDLGITAREAKRLDLRMLIPPSLRRARAAERAEKSRRARGAASRAEQQSVRLEHGREAIRLREVEGLTRIQIAERLGGVSPSYVDKAVKEAKAVALIRPKRARKTKEELNEDSLEAEILDQKRERRIADREAEAIAAAAMAGSHDSSRYMSNDAGALVAAESPAYHGDIHGVAPPSSEEHERLVSGLAGRPFSVSAPRQHANEEARRRHAWWTDHLRQLTRSLAEGRSASAR